MMNAYKGGPFQEAISGLTNLNNDWYGGNAYQTYAFEYAPGDDGYITWYVGADKTWTMKAPGTRANGNIGKRIIPEEPMTIIANSGMSNSFAAIDVATIEKGLPSLMSVDYIRIYQDEDQDTDDFMTCDPPGYPTTDYIRKHPEPYANPNLTDWSVIPTP
jgi:beta-glucanase (GH16 family)